MASQQTASWLVRLGALPFLIVVALLAVGQSLAQSGGNVLLPAEAWHDDFCSGSDICEVGDVNGDGRADLVAFVRGTSNTGRGGDVYVALADSSDRFGPAQRWHDWFCAWDEVCRVGDVNGDSRADAISFTRTPSQGGGEGDVWVSLSTGSSFGNAAIWHDNFCVGQEQCEVADVNGDGRGDLVALVRGSTSNVWTAFSDGTRFGQTLPGIDYFCRDNDVCRLADVTGDGRADIVAFQMDADRPVFVARSTGQAFTPDATRWATGICNTADDACLTGDVDGDRIADVVIFSRATGQVNVLHTEGMSFGASLGTLTDFCFTGQVCRVADVTGDGRADLVDFVKSSVDGTGAGDVRVSTYAMLLTNSADLAPSANNPDPTLNSLSPVQPGDLAEVTADVYRLNPSGELPLYDGLPPNGRQIGTLTPTTLVDVLEGPISVAEGSTVLFYRVQNHLVRSISGWIAVAYVDQQIYTLQAVGGPTFMAQNVPTSSSGQSYTLIEGSLDRNRDQFVVTTAEGAGLRVRAQPGLGGQVIRELQAGHLLLRLSAPVQVDNLDWWYVIDYDKNFSGFVVAGENGEVWLKPVALTDSVGQVTCLEPIECWNNGQGYAGAPYVEPAPGGSGAGSSAGSSSGSAAGSSNSGPVNVRLYYNATIPVFTLQNVSGQALNLTPLSFVGNGLIVPAAIWQGYSYSPLETFQGNGCLMLWPLGVTEQPAPAECGSARQGWITQDGYTFWTGGSFNVFYQGQQVATCQTAAGRCEVTLP